MLADIAHELARSTEQRIFRICHRKVVAELLVNDQTVIFEIGLAGKCHHGCKDAITELPVKNSVSFFLPDERTCVKTNVVEVHGAKRAVEPVHGIVYLGTLIVEDKRDDVKA